MGIPLAKTSQRAEIQVIQLPPKVWKPLNPLIAGQPIPSPIQLLPLGEGVWKKEKMMLLIEPRQSSPTAS